MKRIFILLIVACTAFKLNAQVQVSNIPFTSSDYVIWARGLFEFNDTVFFQSKNGNYGLELHYLNPSNGKVEMLKDVGPGRYSGYVGGDAEAGIHCEMQNNLFFIASTSLIRSQIYKSDGTPSGTMQLTHFDDYGHISGMTSIADKLFFLFNAELWVSQGDWGTTHLLKKFPALDIIGGLDEKLIFEVNNDDIVELWSSDGTVEGTQLIEGASLGSFENHVYKVLDDKRALLFGVENIYVIDLNKNSYESIYNESFFVEDGSVVELNGKVYFKNNQTNDGNIEIVESDGTKEGTKRIWAVPDNYGHIGPGQLLKYDGDLIFVFFNRDNLTEEANLIRYTVGTGDTSKIVQLGAPFYRLSFMERDLKFIQFNEDKLYCRYLTGGEYQNQAVFINLREGTLFKDSLFKNIRYETVLNGKIYFPILDDQQVWGIWSTDGTLGGTRLESVLSEENAGPDDDLIYNYNYNGQLLYLKKNTNKINWYSYLDGSNQLTSSQKSYVSVGHPRKIRVNKKDELFYVNSTDMMSVDLFKLDNKLIPQIVFSDWPLNFMPEYNNIVSAKDNVYFMVSDGDEGSLFKYDGTGCKLVNEISGNYTLETDGNYIYGINSYKGLFITDGADTNLKLINKQIHLNEIYNTLDEDNFMFSGWTDEIRFGLWKCNGTDAGTELLYSFDENYFVKGVSLGRKLYFVVSNPKIVKFELWCFDIDKAEAYPVQVPDSDEFITVNYDVDLKVIDNDLYFGGYDKIHGEELRKIDGSSHVLSLVNDVNKGSEGSYPQPYLMHDNVLYFRAYDEEHGEELWRSDGTEEGTFMIKDLLPGAEGSYPVELVLIDNDLYFVATTEDKENQVWKLSLSDNRITGITPQLVKESIVGYPNPVSNIFTIKSMESVDYAEVYSATGKLMHRFKNVRGNQLDLSKLPTGLYLISVGSKDENSVIRVVKQ